MDVRTGGPAEPEEADGDGESAYEGGGKAFLGNQFAIFVELGFEDFVEVEEKRGDDDDKGADEDTDEGETLLVEFEVVDAFEDDGEGFEPDVEEAVDECYVEVQQEDDGFAEVERDGADEGDEGDVFGRHFLADQFGLAG